MGLMVLSSWSRPLNFLSRVNVDRILVNGSVESGSQSEYVWTCPLIIIYPFGFLA